VPGNSDFGFEQTNVVGDFVGDFEAVLASSATNSEASSYSIIEDKRSDFGQISTRRYSCCGFCNVGGREKDEDVVKCSRCC